MSLIYVDGRSRTPIYEQIVNCVKNLVYTGDLKADDALPSVRSLAAELAINPNTIQKAYNLLESDGIIYSLPARGSFISGNTSAALEARKKELLSELGSLMKELKRLGCSSDEIRTEMDLSWRDCDDKNE